jgi:hypothetical protein
MRRLDLLITQSRKNTGNENFTETTGISDEQHIEAANHGQEYIQSIVSTIFTDLFQVEKIIDTTPNESDYDIPADALLGTRIDLVEYSPTGNESDYYNVNKGNKREKLSGISSTPSFYIRRNKTISLQPQPSQSSGKLRITYQQALPKLDIRRGTVLSSTTSGSSLTSLVLDFTQQIDDTELLEENYITVVNKLGEIQMAGIPISAIDTTTGVVTIDAGFTFEDGETISVGDYVLRGKRSTTHSELADTFERFLLAYTNWKVFKIDSSQDSVEAQEELRIIGEDIKAACNEPDGDVSFVPILNGEYLTED